MATQYEEISFKKSFGGPSTMEYVTMNGLNREVSRIGLGTWSIGGFMWGGTDEHEALETIRAALQQMNVFRRAAPLHTAQPPYNLFERGVERDVLPFCRIHGVSTLTYGSLCRGLLSGKMKAETEFRGDDIRKMDPKFQQPRYTQYLTAVERLDRFAQENYGTRVLELAIRWTLDQPFVAVALWGARHPNQLRPIADVGGWKLDLAALKAIDEIVRESISDPAGPEFMAPPSRPAQKPDEVMAHI